MRTIGETRCNFLVKDTRIPTRFSHEETQHVGTAQSVVTEVIPRERPGRPDVDPQRGARDETELELTVESRSFVNRVKDQVRKDRNEFQMLQKMERNIL